MKNYALSLIAFSLLQGSSLFGDKYNVKPEMEWNGNPVPQAAAFNAPARIEVKNPCNFFFTSNFIFWSPLQENMELGIVADTSDPAFVRGGDGRIVRQSADYAPGFQVGLGGNFNYDGWEMFTQYTWFRNTSTTSSDVSGDDFLVPFWIKPTAAAPTFLHGQEKWRLEMDLADIELGRSYYTGKQLVFRPFYGIRAALIRQHIDVDYLNETTGLVHENIFADQTTRSWGLGPRAGLGMNWLFCHGLRVYGNGSADILYTQYTKLHWKEHATTVAGVVPPGSRIDLEEKNLGYLRTHLALDLGLGWGSYFNDSRYHFDLSLGYGFQVFFNQNMFRAFFADGDFASIAPNGDLFLHGLTLSTRFDF